MDAISIAFMSMFIYIFTLFSSLESRIICLSDLIHDCSCHHNECKATIIVGFHHSELFERQKIHKKVKLPCTYEALGVHASL